MGADKTTPENILGYDPDSDEEGEPRDEFERKYKYTYGEVAIFPFWLASFGVFIAYLFFVIQQFEYLNNNPATTQAYVYKDSHDFPAVTICNIEPETSLDLGDCSYSQYFSKLANCKYNDHLSSTTLKLQDFDRKSHSCFQFNNNGGSILSVESTGYNGSFSFLFSSPQSKSGTLVSFHEPGKTPSFTAINVASLGMDNFFTIRKKEFVDSTGQETVYFNTTFTSLALMNAPSNSLIVSFAYSDLNVMRITVAESRNWIQLLGDIAGMAGVLFGLDIVKGVRAIKVLVETWDNKDNLKSLYETLN